MWKWISRIIIAIALIVFAYSAYQLYLIWNKYRVSEVANKQAIEEFVKTPTSTPNTPYLVTDSDKTDQKPQKPDYRFVYAPFEVDFTALKKTNRDAIGWLYCEDSVINYPVVWGRNNSYYLYHNYQGHYDPCGAIFSDCENVPGFDDYNVIIYGHHIYNKTMLATIDYWLKQEYYDEHPCMWLLTPEQDYRIDLFSCYVTPGDSDMYAIFHESGEELDEYLKLAVELSEIDTPVEIESDAHYVVFSTCSYTFSNARTLLHGKLVPIGSAGGVPLFKINNTAGNSVNGDDFLPTNQEIG